MEIGEPMRRFTLEPDDVPSSVPEPTYEPAAVPEPVKEPVGVPA